MAVPQYANHYRCPDDGTEWTKMWDCMCDDRCPTCDYEIVPYKSDDLPARPEFINYYRCPDDGTEWTMIWDCMCDDRCPTCGHEIEPYRSEDLPVYRNREGDVAIRREDS
jgi:uncharacterized protein (DUF983 family)